MPRKYDQDGQPMMSKSEMLQMLVDEIPATDRKFAHLESQISRLDKKIDGVATDLRQLNFKTDQNHVTFITNQMDQEKRITALETRI